MATSAAAQKKTQKTYIPWDNGKLVVSEEGTLPETRKRCSFLLVRRNRLAIARTLEPG
ncbi:FIG00414732: hypothetical protein [Bacteroides xylanisolvens SD CC 2a]|nr:FIG00414732: hypothetical protein [Bacteroides xylanisolvens SD CC 2a]